MVSKKINKSTTVTLNTKNPHLVLQKAREVLTPLCAQLTMDAPAYFLQVITCYANAPTSKLLSGNCQRWIRLRAAHLAVFLWAVHCRHEAQVRGSRNHGRVLPRHAQPSASSDKWIVEMLPLYFLKCLLCTNHSNYSRYRQMQIAESFEADQHESQFATTSEVIASLWCLPSLSSFCKLKSLSYTLSTSTLFAL